MIDSYICQVHMHIGCGESARSCGCHCHRPVYTEEIPMTDFPERNTYFLKRRVASGMPRLDGSEQPTISPEDVAQLPVGTLFDDQRADGSVWLWVRVDPALVAHQFGEPMVLCVYSSDGTGIATTSPAGQATNLSIIGALPNTPAALVGAPQG